METHGGRIWAESDESGLGTRFTFTVPAAEEAGENDPHQVLFDLMLPGTDGIELMKDILDVTSVPVIFLAVGGQEEVVARAFDLGAADYAVKPLSPTELPAQVRAALRRRAGPDRAGPSEPYVQGELTIN